MVRNSGKKWPVYTTCMLSLHGPLHTFTFLNQYIHYVQKSETQILRFSIPQATAMIFHFLLLFLALYMLNNFLFAKFQNLPPSPFPTLPFIGHLHLLKNPLHRTLSKISNRHGPVLLLRFGSRPVLLVSSPSAAEECFTKNDIVFANRPRLLAGKHFGYNHTSIAWAPYGDHWRNLRRISTVEILSSHRLQTLSHIRIDEVRSLQRHLFGGQNQIVDLKSAFFELTLNVMMRMIAGKRYCNYGDCESEVEEARRFKEIVVETFRLGGSNIIDFLPILKWIGTERRFIDLQKKRDRFMQDLIEEHRIMAEDGGFGGGREKTMIGVLLGLQKSQPEYYKDEIIRGITLALLSAGTETSAGTMEWAMSLLLNSPQHLKKAQSEIDNLLKHDHRLLDESDISNLPFLHCIINETLRMFPAGPLLVPHESSEKCMVGGYNVPRGTMLLVNLWAIQNDPKIWEDPLEFRPERFEGVEGVRDGFRLMPFGSGRRRCPGEGLAMRIVMLALGAIIQCFEWERAGEEMVDLSEGLGLTMPKEKPLLAKCRPRTNMVKLLSQI